MITTPADDHPLCLRQHLSPGAHTTRSDQPTEDYWAVLHNAARSTSLDLQDRNGRVAPNTNRKLSPSAAASHAYTPVTTVRLHRFYSPRAFDSELRGFVAFVMVTVCNMGGLTVASSTNVNRALSW